MEQSGASYDDAANFTSNFHYYENIRLARLPGESTLCPARRLDPARSKLADLDGAAR